MKSVELLAPAGNLKKLKLAFYYGADAVYCGGKAFSLRTFADNFTDEELREGIEYAHARGKKVYVAANIFARNGDFSRLKEYLRYLEQVGADAVLLSDPGAILLAKECAPKLPIHISTQANTTNAFSARFWKEIGAERVVLARELSLAEIAEIHAQNPSLQLEAFVHGAMCISYSGRCLLSDYLDGRSSNRGACVQACRWNYRIQSDNGKNGEWVEISEDEKGTYLLNSKDLNMSAYLNELKEAGVCSFKIEGRMKSEYYLATVINAYRRLLDGAPYGEMEGELSACAHRAYTTAYAFGENSETVNYDDSQTKGSYDYIANVLSSDGFRVSVEMRNRFFEGEILEVLSPSNCFKKTITVSNLRDESGESCTDAKRVQATYVFDCDLPLTVGDILRRKSK